MSTKAFAIGLDTPSYLSEQFSSLSNTMEEGIKALIKNGSAISEVEFDEDVIDVPAVFHPEHGDKVTLGKVCLEGDTINVYDDCGDLIDDYGYIDYDSQLLIYTAVYNTLARED